MQIGQLTAQINPVLSNKNVRSRAVCYNRVWLYASVYGIWVWNVCPIINGFFYLGILLLGFSAYKNTKVLFATSDKNSSGKSEILHCLNGIRFISMTWVVLGHVFGNFVAAPSNNFLFYISKVSKIIKNIYSYCYFQFFNIFNSPLPTLIFDIVKLYFFLFLANILLCLSSRH